MMADPVLKNPIIKAAPAPREPIVEVVPGLGKLTRETLHWLETNSTQIAISIGVAIGFYFFLVAVRWLVIRLTGDGHAVTSWRGFVGDMARRTTGFFLAAFAAYEVTHLIAPAGPLTRFIDITFTIAVAVQGAIWMREAVMAFVVSRSAAREQGDDLDSAINVIRVIVNVAVWLLALVLVLDNIGVNVTALVAGLGVGGIAIGLAAQGIFSDLFAALSILFDRPFRVGDTIRFGEVTGTVEAIGLKTTRIRAITGEQVVISNTKLLDQQIRNLRRIEARTTVMTFHLDLGSPTAALARVPAMLVQVLAALRHVEMRRAHVTAVTATSIEVEVEFTVEDASLMAMLDTRQQVLLGSLDGFRELGLTLADATPKVQPPAAVATAPKPAAKAR
jgi:small-conductance mechanosensitive channel